MYSWLQVIQIIDFVHSTEHDKSEEGKHNGSFQFGRLSFPLRWGEGGNFLHLEFQEEFQLIGGVLFFSRSSVVGVMSDEKTRNNFWVQNNGIEVGTKLIMNWDQESQSVSQEMSPDYNSTSAKLYCRHKAFWQKAFSRRTPNLDTEIRLVEIEP
ncbi:hypothetical protein TNCV_817291 [Trichonephila clavipes]|nr:hypothetical protein TNCV_817291 [Trichonephila clavipes]